MSVPYAGQPQGYGTNPYPQGQPGYPPAGAAPYQAGYPPAGGPPPQGYPPAGGAPPQGYPPAAGQPYPPAAGQHQGYPPAQQGYVPQQYAGAPPAAAGGLPAGAVAQPTYQGEKPSEDVHDDPNRKEPQPTAPPIESMDQISGYSGGGGFVPPPAYDEATRPHAPDSRPEISNLPVINEEQAREALLQHVSENCCYGKGAAQDLKFADLKSTSAFHYTLETFGESRSTSWAFEPFKGQPVVGPEMGPAPGPWDIQVNPGELFVTKEVKMEVPHTASVKPCHTCHGAGRVRCYRCVGRGQVICSSCSGKGHKRTLVHDSDSGNHHENQTCTFCHGSGRRRCTICHGHGQTNCKTCDARGQLKCFIQLKVKWENHFEDHIVERTELPSELIRNVRGQLAFEEQNMRVWPINHFPDQQINSASSSLVQKHSTAFPTERILKQRHRVRIIPVTEAIYEWKGQINSYFIYGFENKVHAPNYPQTCCCGCVIL